MLIDQFTQYEIESILKALWGVLLSVLCLLVDVRHSLVVFLRRLLPLFCHFIQRNDNADGSVSWLEHSGKFSSQQLFLHCPTFSIIGLASPYYYYFFLLGYSRGSLLHLFVSSHSPSEGSYLEPISFFLIFFLGLVICRHIPRVPRIELLLIFF